MKKLIVPIAVLAALAIILAAATATPGKPGVIDHEMPLTWPEKSSRTDPTTYIDTTTIYADRIEIEFHCGNAAGPWIPSELDPFVASIPEYDDETYGPLGGVQVGLDIELLNWEGGIEYLETTGNDRGRFCDNWRGSYHGLNWPTVNDIGQPGDSEVHATAKIGTTSMTTTAAYPLVEYALNSYGEYPVLPWDSTTDWGGTSGANNVDTLAQDALDFGSTSTDSRVYSVVSGLGTFDLDITIPIAVHRSFSINLGLLQHHGDVAAVLWGQVTYYFE